LAACLLLAGFARAEPRPLRVALDYRAPESCPDDAAFRAQVLGRTPRVRFAAQGAPSDLLWRVTLAETASGARGALRVSSEQQGPLERRVTAADCARVASALSLVAALSVDPDASLSTQETEASPPHAPPPSAKREPRTASPPPPPPARAGTGAARLSLGLSLAGRTGLAPHVSWAPRPFVAVSLRSKGGHTWGIGLSATQAPGSASLALGQADFTWSLGRLEAFPVRASFGAWRLEPALFFEAGQLRARGVGVAPSSEVRRPALFAGALGRASFLAFNVLVLQIEAGPLVALERDRFYLFENTTIFRVPRLTGAVAVGVGLEFL
jgi:hypothetical protein